jgi:hypothetical protein
MSNQVEPGVYGGAAQGQGDFGSISQDEGGFSSAVQEQDAREQQQIAQQQVPGDWEPPHPFHGRTVSWVAVSIVMVGFLAGGLALVFGPAWWLFWVGLGVAAVGGLMAMAINIFEDWY